MYKFRIGILNTENGKVKIEKDASQEEALKTAKKVSRWFDKKDTFFSGVLWEHWERLGIVKKFEAVVSGRSLGRIASECIVVFNGNKGTEYEFFIERVED